ncbi:hypothetical protein HZS_5319 [Henneguya salminicola]|nr:hypothetical protein HZS_5319 [Henneguya salminicola]
MSAHQTLRARAIFNKHMSRRKEKSSRLFVGNLPRDIREREVEDIFYKYGKIREINIRSSKNRGPSFAFVEFDDHRDAQEAIHARDGYDFDGYRIRVEPSNSQGDYKARPRGSSPTPNRRNPPRRSSYRVQVSNFPSSGSWQDLKDHMRQAGEVLFADVYKDGTAVVEFARHDDMKNALQTLNGSTFKSPDGSAQIELREDHPKSSRSPSNRSSRSKASSHRSRSASRSRSRTRSRSRSSVDSAKRSRSASRRRGG